MTDVHPMTQFGPDSCPSRCEWCKQWFGSGLVLANHVPGCEKRPVRMAYLPGGLFAAGAPFEGDNDW